MLFFYIRINPFIKIDYWRHLERYEFLFIWLEWDLNLDLFSTFTCNHFMLLLAAIFQVCHIAEKRMIRIFFCSEIWSEPLRQSSKCIKSNKWTYSVQLKRSIYQSYAGKLCLLFQLTLSHLFSIRSRSLLL